MLVGYGQTPDSSRVRLSTWLLLFPLIWFHDVNGQKLNQRDGKYRVFVRKEYGVCLIAKINYCKTQSKRPHPSKSPPHFTANITFPCHSEKAPSSPLHTLITHYAQATLACQIQSKNPI
uniref:Putative secreted proline rich peptide n=1 Tax=Ixodes scapularis TaxID=6945 RepID=Q4PN64_IXOSC|nr:putative secreted proline rich peptide [Ixodes scapularis]